MSATEIIEGSFTVVATRDLPAERTFRSSPNVRRLVARILFWNTTLLFVAIAGPILL